MKVQLIFCLIFGVSCIGLHTSCEVQRVTEQRQPPVNIKQPNPPGNDEQWDNTNAKEFLTISKLKKKNPSAGIYETE